MPCAKSVKRLSACMASLALLSACSQFSKDAGQAEAGGGQSAGTLANAPPTDRDPGKGVSAVAKSGGTAKRVVKLSPPEAPRSWADARLQAAKRLVAANPDSVYTGKPPDMLLAIPVLTVELNGDGTVRNIKVVRYPSQARETVAMAMDAVHRAAPYGDVSRLPKPWRFNETFLFNDDKKFKPMTLDLR